MQPPLFQRSSRFGYRRWRRLGWLLVHLAPDTPHKARDGCDPACRRSSTSRDSRKVCCAAADLSGSHATGDPPPLKWSDLRYVFDIKEDCNGKEAIQA